ncbi:DUF3951 domain-containing protein [Metabacillus sp. HB246100]
MISINPSEKRFNYTLFILFIISIVCFRIYKKKTNPNNKYTPYNDITGRSDSF